MALKFRTKLLLAMCVLAILSLAVPTFIVFFVARPIRIEGQAMKPGLNNGDRVLFWNRSAGGKLERGDVVIFYYPLDTSKSYVKRVVGLPGEKLKVKGEKIFINDQVLPEPYVAQKEPLYKRQDLILQVPSGNYFMLGDNRNFSVDSRDFGAIPDELIYGKMLFRYAVAN